jgi:hypothetical protein
LIVVSPLEVVTAIERKKQSKKVKRLLSARKMKVAPATETETTQQST